VYCVHGEIELFIYASHSLKERRSVINSLKSRLQRAFNISVADISEDHVWQRAKLGFALAASSYAGLEETMERINRHLGGLNEVEVIAFDYEFIQTGGKAEDWNAAPED